MTSSSVSPSAEPIVYQGQFGDFTVTDDDRRGVLIYRAALAIAALCFGLGSGLVLWPAHSPAGLAALTPLYVGFMLAFGVSLWTIHIYMAVLHRALQVLWGIGAIASVVVASSSPLPLALTVYEQPLTMLGVGFSFAALTGLFVKEAFCFNRLETKLLTPIVPVLLLGHLAGLLPPSAEQLLLGIWALLFAIFAIRKCFQAIPPDIGDKSVFDYLHRQRQSPHESHS